MSAVLVGLSELRDGLSQVTSRLETLETTVERSESETATSRADIAAVQVRADQLQNGRRKFRLILLSIDPRPARPFS